MNNEQFNQVYIEEALELLDSIENNILKLEHDLQNKEIINEIFRALHTIKGSGSMFGFTQISNITHKLESLYDSIRKNNSKISSQIIEITLTYCDVIHHMLTDSKEEVEKEFNQLLYNLENFQIKKKVAPETIVVKQDVEKGERKVVRILFKPSPNILLRGINPKTLIMDLKKLGECYVYANTKNIPSYVKLQVDICYMEWSFLIITNYDINHIKDVFIFIEGDSTVEIHIIDHDKITKNINYKRIGEILVEHHHISKEELNKILSDQKLFGEQAITKGIVSEYELQSALKEQEIIRQERKHRKNKYESIFIRVHHEKLDELVNLIGELVTLEARLKQFSMQFKSNELEAISEQMNRLTNNLRENTMNLRMIPLDKIFSSFHRLVRDLAMEVDKNISLHISGGDTELDKNVIESLKDPLVHLIRNCVDHGIESKDTRIKKNKDVIGNINILAEYSGSYVTITIKDDGKGIDLNKLKEKAAKQKLIDPKNTFTQNELLNLIFLPGLSTNDKASTISGRGVGMDIVKKNIEKLRGFIDIYSEQDKGTQFTIKIPLTLAIIDGLLFRVGSNNFILNLSVVEECLDFTEKLQLTSQTSQIIHHRNMVIPYISIRSVFDIKGKKPDTEQIILVKTVNKTIGLLVDKVLGKHQTVIKSISQVFNHIEEVAGTTILGDGTIALIIDIGKILANVEKQFKTQNKVVPKELQKIKH